MNATGMATEVATERRWRIDALGFDYSAQPKEEVGACNLCGAETWTEVTCTDRYGYAAPAVSCHRCGLTALSPRMTGSAYARFYDGVYRPLVSAYHGRLIDARTVQDEQRAYAAAMARFVAPYLQRLEAPTLLDVGGSTGVVAAHLARTFGLRATVLDPAPAEIEEARALGVETITALVEDWDPRGRQFDVVGMFQTIDHLLDVRSTLAKLRSLLRPDGYFIVDIVDFRAAYLRNWSVEAAVKIDHPYYLTQDTADAYLRRAGFDVRRKSFSADHLHVTYVCTPGEASDALPSGARVEAFFDELRYVQNAPRPGGA